jgi:hypothetical protein
MILQKVISGGQNGVDQAGLRAAHKLGITTGGWAPHGWQTLDGPAPWLVEYGLVEHVSGYAARTEANVRDSNATIRIARFWNSSGERCTLRAILKWGRQYYDVRSQNAVEECHRWLIEKEVRVLNVAGNAEQTAPGIGDTAERFLTAVFEGLLK